MPPFGVRFGRSGSMLRQAVCPHAVSISLRDFTPESFFEKAPLTRCRLFIAGKVFPQELAAIAVDRRSSLLNCIKQRLM